MEALLDANNLQKVFDMLDTQRLGYLVQSDLETMCQHMQIDVGQVQFLMQMLDRDGDGKITVEDFRVGFGQVSQEQLVALSPQPRRRTADKDKEKIGTSPLARTPSGGSQGRPDSGEGHRNSGRRIPSVTLTDPSHSPQSDPGESIPSDGPLTKSLFNPESGGNSGLRPLSGLEGNVTTSNKTADSYREPAMEDVPGSPSGREMKQEGTEVEPKFTLNLKRFGRRSRPLSETFPHEDNDDDLFGDDSPSPESHSPGLVSPTRGKRQHFLDGFRHSGGSEYDGPPSPSSGLAPQTPQGRDGHRFSSAGNKVGLHSIAEALTERSPGSESRSPLMASTPTTGKKLLRMRSPLSHFSQGQEFFETAGPLSPVTELSQEFASTILEERVRSVLEECNISPGRAINKTDFSLVCQQLNMNLPDEQVDELFEQLDTTAEGFISLDGFVEGVSNSFNASQVSLGSTGSLDSWSQQKSSPGMAPDGSLLSKLSARRGSASQRPATPMQRSNSSNRVSTPFVPFNHKQELFPVLTKSLDPDGTGAVKIDTIYKVWQDSNLDMEDEESNAIRFLQTVEMNTNNTVDVSKITSRLESALENGDDSSASDRYLALHFIYREVHSLRMQCYQTDMETEKVRSNFVRMQEERDRLILEGDDHADHLTRKHELKLRDIDKKWAEKLASRERDIGAHQERVLRDEAMQRQRLEQALEDSQAEEKNLRAELKLKQDLLDQQEQDIAEANSEIHDWKSQVIRLKDDLSAQHKEAMELLQRESADKEFQEQLELEIEKRMETERESFKQLQDQCDELKADRDHLRNQLSRKLSRERRPSTKRPRTRSDAARLKDVRVKPSPKVIRKGSARLHVPSAGGLATPNMNRRSLNLDLDDLSDFEDTSADTSLMKPLDMSLMDELKTDNKSPVDEDKLELLGKQETLEREKQELLESNRIAQEKFGKMEAVLDEIKAAREKSENELGLLQNALKAVEMQKTQLLASNQNLHGQLEEVNSQLVTSRQNCRDTEDRVITLNDNLDTAKRQSTEHSEARKKLEATAAEQEEKLVTAMASLGSAQDKFEESIQAKEALEIQVADVNEKLNIAVAKCAELEQTLLDSDSSLRDELSKQQEIQREQKEDLEATIQRLQSQLEDAAGKEDTLNDLQSQKETLTSENSSLVESLDALTVDRASALNDVVVLQASVTELQMAHEDLQQKFNETNAALEETRGKLDEVTGEKDILESSRSQLEEEVSGQRKDQETTKQQLEEELARAKVTWEESFKVINAKLDDTTLKHEEAESRAANISTQLASLEAEYALMAGERDTAYSQHQTAAEERDALQRNLDAAEESLKDLQEKLVTLKVVSDNRNQESLEEWDQRHHKLEQELEEERSRTKTMALELTMQSEQAIGMRRDISSLMLSLNEATESRCIQNEPEDSEDKETHAKSWESTFKDLKDGIEFIIGRLEGAKGLSQSLQALEDEKTSLENDKDATSEECRGIRRQLEKAEEMAEELEKELDGARKDFTNVSTQLSAAQVELQNLGGKLEQRELLLQELESEVARDKKLFDDQALSMTLELEKVTAERNAKIETAMAQLELVVASLKADLHRSEDKCNELEATHTAKLEDLQSTHRAEVEQLKRSNEDECEAIRQDIMTECDTTTGARLQKQAETHSAELVQLAEKHQLAVHGLKGEVSTLQAQVIELKRAASDSVSSGLVVDLRAQVQDLEMQMAGERAQKTDLQSQLRGAISDNTRMVRDMTRLQHQIQAQADSRDDELKEVQQEVEEEVRQRVMAEANSKHQLEISCLKEDLRGSERLRHLANNNWTEEKDVLMNIIQQLTSTITMDLSSAGASRPSRHTTSALSGVY